MASPMRARADWMPTRDTGCKTFSLFIHNAKNTKTTSRSCGWWPGFDLITESVSSGFVSRARYVASNSMSGNRHNSAHRWIDTRLLRWKMHDVKCSRAEAPRARQAETDVLASGARPLVRASFSRETLLSSNWKYKNENRRVRNQFRRRPIGSRRL